MLERHEVKDRCCICVEHVGPGDIRAQSGVEAPAAARGLGRKSATSAVGVESASSAAMATGWGGSLEGIDHHLAK